jgi:hypothetical protein
MGSPQPDEVTLSRQAGRSGGLSFSTIVDLRFKGTFGHVYLEVD